VSFLHDDPILLVFLVAAAGYLAGRVRIGGAGGFGFGIAAVLFVGIGFGAADPTLKVPQPLWQLGLILFVYTVGLATGPGFLTTLRRRGLGANAAVATAILAGAAAAAGLGSALGLGGAAIAGTFTGGLTNTPALAGTLDALHDLEPGAGFDAQAGEVLVGFSLAYPIGVTIALAAVFALARRRSRFGSPAPADEALVVRTALVQGDHLGLLGDVRTRLGASVTFGRVKRDGASLLATDDVELRAGDRISIVGAGPAVAAAIAQLGQESAEHVELEREDFDFRRIVVSSRDVAGRTLEELDLAERLGGTVTRVRRGDVDMLAVPELALELGDRVRVVAPRAQMPAISSFFGDSYRALRELDVLSFSVGVALGLALGAVEVPLPGGGSFSLGFAGGPLLVGLALGALGRTGPIVWQLPHSANLTLRQFGIVVFLAGVGVNSGQAFADTIVSREALSVLATAIAVAAAGAAVTVAAGTTLLRLPLATLVGVVAGMQTQPAVLAAAAEREQSDTELNVGYVTVVPLAMIAKIVLAPVLLRLFL
jgi:putative transport protein